MSNYLAIATVTAALADMLQTAILPDVAGATVTTLRPDNDGGMPASGVNVFLYHVAPNAAWRNNDVPTRRGDGDVVQRPQAALDLHYLMTCCGADAQLEPQRLLGSVVRTLHARPILTRAAIRRAIASEKYNVLAKSNLADDVDLVRVTPLPLSLEDLSKLWSVYFQTSYRLSVAYQATVVLIEGEQPTRAALPVRQRDLYVVPFRQPLIEEITSADDPEAPIGLEMTVVIRGKRLRGDITEVHVGDRTITPAGDKISDWAITIALPAGLRAGVHGLQVDQPRLMGTPPVAHRGVESNLAPFVLHPRIVAVSYAAPDITVQITPRVGNAQRAVLLLNELNARGDRAPHAYSFDAAPRNKESDPEDSDSLTFPTNGVVAGADYLVRVQIDGADSALERSADPNDLRYVGPKVTIP